MLSTSLLELRPFARDLRWRPLWRGLGWLFIGGVAYLSLAPPPPEITPSNDKLTHFLVYAALMGWFVQLYRRPAHAGLAARLILLGAALEWAQLQTTDRVGDLWDAAANGAGVAFGFLVAGTRVAAMLRTIENLLLGQAPHGSRRTREERAPSSTRGQSLR